MKKLFSILLAVMLVLSVAACTGENKPADTDGTGAVTTDAGTAGDTGADTTADTKNADTTADTTADTDEPIIVTEPDDTTAHQIPEVPESGFCAVGVVDDANKKVAVALWSGTVKTFTYEGDAPTLGIAYYELDGDKIVLDCVELVDYNGWRLFDDANGELLYGFPDGATETRCYFAENSACFCKFSDTNYNIYNTPGNLFDVSFFDYEFAQTVWPSGLFALDYDGDGTIDVALADATQPVDPSGTVQGDNVTHGFTNVTHLFNQATEDITVGEINIVME